MVSKRSRKTSWCSVTESSFKRGDVVTFWTTLNQRPRQVVAEVVAINDEGTVARIAVRDIPGIGIRTVDVKRLKIAE